MSSTIFEPEEKCPGLRATEGQDGDGERGGGGGGGGSESTGSDTSSSSDDLTDSDVGASDGERL